MPPSIRDTESPIPSCIPAVLAGLVFLLCPLSALRAQETSERTSLRAGAWICQNEAGLTVELPGLLGSAFEQNDGFRVGAWPGADGDALQLVVRNGRLRIRTAREGLFPGHETVGVSLGEETVLTLEGWGTLAQSPNLEVFEDPAAAQKRAVSFVGGTVADLLPEGKRLLGVALITATFTASFPEDAPLHDVDGRSAHLRYAAIAYLDADQAATVDAMADLAGCPVHTMQCVGLDFADGDKHTLLECRQADGGLLQCLSAESNQIMLADQTASLNSLKAPDGAVFTRLRLPTGKINDLVDLGLPKNLDGFLVRSAAGKYFGATLDQMQLMLPGTDVGLSFGPTRLRIFFGRDKLITLETTLKNAGDLFALGGLDVAGEKRVRIAMEGKTLSINFLDALADINPLGFGLNEPTVAFDTENKALILSGRLAVPESLRFLLGEHVRVRGTLGKNEQTLAVLRPAEWKLIQADDPTFGIRLDQIRLGRMDKRVFLLCEGRCELLEDLDPAEKFGLPVEGPKITKDKTLRALLYVEAGKPPSVRLELCMEESLDLNVAPIHGALRDTRLVLTRSKAEGWKVLLAGTTDLDIEVGPLHFNAEATTTLSSDGRLVVAIPEDSENPTRIELAGIASLTLRSGYLMLQAKGKNKQFAVDATVALDISDELPMIGGRTLAGHMAMSTNGTFLFEAVDLPSIDFQDITFAFTTLRLERKLINGQLKVMASMGGKVDFHDDFALPPLAGQELDGKVMLTQNLRLILQVTGGPEGFGVDFGDYRFMMDRVALALGGGSLVTATGEGGLKVRYPSSKWFLKGLPAYIEGRTEGPSFDVGGAIDISPYDIFVRTRTGDTTVIPLDIPGLHEKNNGFTMALSRLGVGFNWSQRYPEFAIQGNLYLPDPEADSTKRVPGTDRKYDSYMGLTFFAYGSEPLALRFMVDPDEPPALRLPNLIELELHETGLSIWLPPTPPFMSCWSSIEHGGLVRIGNPDGGSGFLFNFQGGHHVFFAFLTVPPAHVSLEFFDRLNCRLRLGGFDSELDMSFPRPQLDPGNMMMVLFKLYPILKDMDIEKLKEEIRKPGSPVNALFPVFNMKACHIYLPKVMDDCFADDFPRTRDGRPKLAVFEHLRIDGADGAAMAVEFGAKLAKMVAESNLTERIPRQVISMIPPDKRRGRMKMDMLGLLKGDLHYRIQAAEDIYTYDKVRGLQDLQAIARVTHACRTRGVAPLTPELMQKLHGQDEVCRERQKEYGVMSRERGALLLDIVEAHEAGEPPSQELQQAIQDKEEAMRAKGAEVKQAKAELAALQEVHAAATGQRPIANPNAHTVSLPSGERVEVSADLTRLDPRAELKRLQDYIQARLQPGQAPITSPRELLSRLWRASVADGASLHVKGNVAVFAGRGREERYTLRLQPTVPYGFVADRDGTPGPGFAPGREGRLPGAFPASYDAGHAMTAELPDGREIEWLDVRLDAFLRRGRSRGALDLVRRGEARVRCLKHVRRGWLPPMYTLQWEGRGRLQRGGARQRGEIREPVLGAGGWVAAQEAGPALKSFRLAADLGDGLRVTIDDSGRIQAGVCGLVEMSTRLSVGNGNAREFFTLLRKLRLGDPTGGTPDRKDRIFARAWKHLYGLRAPRGEVRIRGTDVTLTLGHGIRAKLGLSRVRLYYPWRWHYGWDFMAGPITEARVDPETGLLSGKPRNHHDAGGGWGGGWYKIFLPRYTRDTTGAPGLISACGTKERFGKRHLVSRGFLRDDWLRKEYWGGNAYALRLESPGGWIAFTDGTFLRITTPAGASARLLLNRSLDRALQAMAGGPLHQLGSEFQWIVRTKDRSGVASSLNEVLDVARLPEDPDPSRTLAWTSGGRNFEVRMQPEGGLRGMGLTPVAQQPDTSRTRLNGASGAVYEATLKGPGVSVSRIGRGGKRTAAFLDSSKGPERVRLPGVRHKPNGLIVNGNLGMEAPGGEMRGSSWFDGQIFDDGNFDISGSADLSVHGVELANGSMRCSRKHGLTVEGHLDRGLIKGNIEGQVTGSWFCLEGNTSCMHSGTGFKGRAFVDPDHVSAHGSLYVSNRCLADGWVNLTKDFEFEKTLSFSKKANLSYTKTWTVTSWVWVQESWIPPRGHSEKRQTEYSKRISVDYTVGVSAYTKVGLQGNHPSAHVRGKIWIDAQWPVGYHDASFSSGSLNIRKDLGPVRITVDLPNKHFSVEKR